MASGRTGLGMSCSCDSGDSWYRCSELLDESGLLWDPPMNMALLARNRDGRLIAVIRRGEMMHITEIRAGEKKRRATLF